MNNKEKLIAFYSISRKEIVRFLRIWTQTIIPSVITSSLYLIIFGYLIGNNNIYHHTKYINFIFPGIIMMNIINNSYSNVASSFFNAKFTRSIEEVFISPATNYIIILGYISGGILRSFTIGTIIYLFSSTFINIHIINIPIMFFVTLFSSIIFSLLGLISALLANKFDSIMFFPNFFLTPLIYLGGIFYSIYSLPKIWRYLSFINPIFYIINSFRYCFLGFSEVNIYYSCFFILIFTVIIYTASIILINKKRYN